MCTISKAEENMDLASTASEDGRSGPSDRAVSSRAARSTKIGRADMIMLTALLLMKLYFYVALLLEWTISFCILSKTDVNCEFFISLG